MATAFIESYDLRSEALPKILNLLCILNDGEDTHLVHGRDGLEVELECYLLDFSHEFIIDEVAVKIIVDDEDDEV